MKRCTLCRQVKPLSEFNRKRASPDGRQDVCRGCNRQVSADYYRRNREKHLRVVNERKNRMRRDHVRCVLQYLAAHPCIDCGETDVRVLEFDHVREKLANVSSLVWSGSCWDTIAREIQKCDVVCVNCHRRRTAMRSESLRLRLLWERGSRRHRLRQAALWVGDL